MPIAMTVCDFVADLNCKKRKIMQTEIVDDNARVKFAVFSVNGVMPKCTLYHLVTCKSHNPWVVPWVLNGPKGSTPVLFFPYPHRLHPSSAFYCGFP